MDTFQLRIFQRQVFVQCHFVIFSANYINASLQKNEANQIFYGLQNLLNSGANISKMLWGAGGKLAVKRKPLRDSIGISDTSVLREVTMRNNFEHMDERIDKWWKESTRSNYSDMMVGGKNSVVVGLEPIDMFRLFDPETKEVVFWGQEFNVQAIVNEVQSILPKLIEESKKHHMG